MFNSIKLQYCIYQHIPYSCVIDPMEVSDQNPFFDFNYNIIKIRNKIQSNPFVNLKYAWTHTKKSQKDLKDIWDFI